MQRRGTGRSGLRAGARPGGWSALGLSIVSAAAAVVLILTSGTTSGSPAASGLALGHHGQTAVTHWKLSANATPTPPSIAPSTNARQALLAVQSQLGGQLSSTTWSGPQSSPSSSALTSLSALDNTHVWAVGAACTLLFSSNGTSWTQDTHIPAGCAGATNLTGVSVQDNSHGWAVGSGGFVLVCNANCNTSTAVWSKLTGGPAGTPSFTGVWGNGNTVYASTSGAVWVCSANCNNATAGSGGGKSTWTNVSLAGSWMSVSGTGGGTPAFLVGSGGAVRVCKTGPCTTAAAWVSLGSAFGSTPFTSVAAVDGNHVYAVASNGAIWACSNGCNNTSVGSGGGQALWMNVTPVAPGPVPTAFAGVAGAGGGDGSVFAVGPSGAIWFCGQSCATLSSEWVKESPSYPTSISLAGVTASDANHAWTGGAGGAIFGMVSAGPTADAITKSLQALGKVLDPSLWPLPDGNHIDSTKFGPLYDRAKDAESPLDGLKPPQTWAASDVQIIEGAMRLLATTEMADNACSPKKTKELTEAQKELDAGDKEWANGHPDKANDHYKNAYDHANKAQGVQCAGITVTPLGAFFNKSGIVPGDSFSTDPPGPGDPVTVTITNSGGTVGLWVSNLTHTSVADLAVPLQIKVVEYGTPTSPTQLYNGSLHDFAQSPAFVAAQNSSGSTSANWAVGESHVFVITATLPHDTDNTYQGANTGFDLNFGRS